MRSGYSANMRMFPDQPERLVGVTWYRVPNDRPFVPWPHAFGTRVWEYQDDDDPPIGEMNKPRPWKGGQAPATAGDGGICGDADQWFNGCKPDAEIPPPWPGGVVCSRCRRPALRFVGGTGTGGPGPGEIGCCSTLPPPPTLFAQYLGPDLYPDLPPGTVLELPGDWLPGPAPPRDEATWTSAVFPWDGMDMMATIFCGPLGLGQPDSLRLLVSDGLSLFIANDVLPTLTCDPFRADFQLPLAPPIPPVETPNFWRVTDSSP